MTFFLFTVAYLELLLHLTSRYRLLDGFWVCQLSFSVTNE